ncbi:MAG: TIR domain-containing protein [Stenomitos rutilans HA7619-LM2]|jgi:WD40 repeat protein|nr:TIR domain-containing protein [Stenomitos rutilans HA7619-LM2]
MSENVSDRDFIGLKLQSSFLGHEDLINDVVWSFDGCLLASSSQDRTIKIWDISTGKLQTSLENKGRSGSLKSVAWAVDGRTLIAGTTTKSLRSWDLKTNKASSHQGHSAAINCVVFSSDGRRRASASSDKTIRVCDASSGKLYLTLKEHSGEVLSVTFSQDSQLIASGSTDKTVRLWSTKNEKSLRTFHGHTGEVLSVAFSPNQQILASASQDCTVRIWDHKKKRLLNVLEGHTDAVTCVSFSSDGRILASKSADGTIRFWRCDTWDLVKKITESALQGWQSNLAFHPQEPILATLDQNSYAVRLWKLDIEAILNKPSEVPSVRYTNAKAVLLGNTGVGKSGLGLVLTGQAFEKTDSTHGRYVWTLDNYEFKADDHTEIREILLWDLAGQPNYRLIHQLHLNEVAVALIVLDARSDIDPFAGVHYWNRALTEAQRLQGDSVLPLKKFLVAARVDRGSIDASSQKINALVRDLGFDGYFATSAREGWNIPELAEAIRQSIDWNAMPSVNSTELFQSIKNFLIGEKKEGRLLSSAEDLYRAFLQAKPTSLATEDLRPQFETCIGRVESQGLIRRLNFGNLILLQPELLDAYAAALVMAAKDEPDGLGCIAETRASTGDFRMSGDERIPDKKQEKLLLIATIEDLLHHEIALRGSSEDGEYLVFPSQFTRELPSVSDPQGKAVTFEFDGAIQNVYSRLVVRLSHSGLFKKRDMWKNAAIFTTHSGSSCGMLLHQIEDGRAELTLFFDESTSEEMRFQFEEYVNTYLQRQVSLESFRRKRIFVCLECSTPVTEQQVKMRRERGFDWIRCNVCDFKVSLLDREARLTNPHLSSDAEASNGNVDAATLAVAEIDQAADTKRDRETAASVLQGKIVTQDFDVFLCCNDEDKATVRKIGEKLKEAGLLPWLDEWELRPGIPWQRLLEQQITRIKSVAVFVGSENLGPWENQELETFLREFAGGRKPVIPVILPDALKQPKLPIFLKGRNWIDLRDQDSDPMDQLLWGITGKRGLHRDIRTGDGNIAKLENNLYLGELRAKDEQIQIHRQHNADIKEITKLFAGNRIMASEVNQTFNGPVGNVAGTNQGKQQAILNNYAPENRRTLAEAAEEIQKLLEQLSASYPNPTPIEQMTVATKAVEEIEKDPKLKGQVVAALKAGGKTALQELVKHPAITILLAALDAWDKKS